MKKKLQIFSVFVLVFVVVGLANLDKVLANLSQPETEQSAFGAAPLRGEPSPLQIEITQDGLYNIESVCDFQISYQPDANLSAILSADVDPDFSSTIPFGYRGDLYLPGCHVLHYKNGELVKEISGDEGVAEVCFAERPGAHLTVFYYVEEPFATSQIWLELPTTHKENFACASAPYTGEYAVGSKIDTAPPPSNSGTGGQTPGTGGGSVVAPPNRTLITRSGTYGAGGICSLIVLYREPFQTNELHVADSLRHPEDPVDDYNYTDHDIFPDPDAYIHYPGCHVLHFKDGELTHWEKSETLGNWEICFATVPNREMTIYVYLGDLEVQASSWQALETTTEGGQACAPAFYTGVYVPTGK